MVFNQLRRVFLPHKESKRGKSPIFPPFQAQLQPSPVSLPLGTVQSSAAAPVFFCQYNFFKYTNIILQGMFLLGQQYMPHFYCEAQALQFHVSWPPKKCINDPIKLSLARIHINTIYSFVFSYYIIKEGERGGKKRQLFQYPSTTEHSSVGK